MENSESEQKSETAPAVDPGQVYYFGKWPGDEGGHFLWSPTGNRISSYKATVLGYPPVELLDGEFCPKGRQIEGLAQVTLFKGWSILAFWDRSGDKRGGSNSAFLAKGQFGFEELLKAARIQYPKHFERMDFEVRLVAG